MAERSDAMKRLIDAYKFNRVKAAHIPLTDMLCEVVPVLYENTVVVPVPTVASHIRQRGYDHTYLLSRRLALKKQVNVSSVLRRNHSHVQRGASKLQRRKQAESAFKCIAQLDGRIPYVLVDDIVTTGATLQYAAQALRDAGAVNVHVVVLARQPLDK